MAAASPTTAPPRRLGLAVLAAVVAVPAWVGAVGLALRVLGLPPEVEERLPFGSPALGGLALAVVVAVPASWLAWMAWHGDRRTDLACLACGGLLVGWIVVQLLVIREPSPFQPIYLVVGLVFLALGRGAVRRGSRP